MPQSESYYPEKQDYKCVRCENQTFTSWNDYENHHVKHAVNLTISGLPIVRLMPLKLKPRKVRNHGAQSNSCSEVEPVSFDIIEKYSNEGASDVQQKQTVATSTSCQNTSLLLQEAHINKNEVTTASAYQLENDAGKLVTTVSEVLPANTSEILVDTLSLSEKAASSELSPEIVSVRSVEDPLGLNQGGLASTKVGSESSPASSCFGNIRVLPFETMVSPSVVKAGNDKMFTPLRPVERATDPIYENGAMVAIPEQNLADLILNGENNTSGNSLSLQDLQENGRREKHQTKRLPDATKNRQSTSHSASKKTTESPLPRPTQSLEFSQSLQQQQSYGRLDQQQNQGLGGRTMHQQLAGNQQRMLVSCAPIQPLSTAPIQRNHPGTTIRMCGPTSSSSMNGNLRPVAPFTVRAQLSPTMSTSVAATQNGVHVNANPKAGNTGPRSGSIHQNLLRPQQSAQIQHLNLQPPVQSVRPEFQFHQSSQLLRNPVFPLLHLTNGYPPVQQIPRQQIRPSSFVVVRPQNSSAPTMIASPARVQMVASTPVPIRGQSPQQATPNQVAIQNHIPLQTVLNQPPVGTQSPLQGALNQAPVRAQVRPQVTHNQVSIRSQIGPQQAAPMQVAIRSQRPHRLDTPDAAPNQLAQIRAVVRQPVRPALPSGSAVMGDTVRQAAPAPTTGQQPSSTVLSSAQKRPLAIESGLHYAQPRCKAQRVSGNKADEVSITSRSTNLAHGLKNVSIDLPSPTQEDTFTTLMNNPNITLVPSKNKESALNAGPLPKRTEPALVDLTAESNLPAKETSWRKSLTCQVCNQMFNNADLLKTHLVSHLRRSLDKNSKPQVVSAVRPSMYSGPQKPKSPPASVSTHNVNQSSIVEQVNSSMKNDDSAALGSKQCPEMTNVVPLNSTTYPAPTTASETLHRSAEKYTATSVIVTNSVSCTAPAATSTRNAADDMFTCFENSSADSLVLPLIDVNREGAIERLEKLGITQCLPVTNLISKAANQKLVIPILSVSSLRNSLSGFSSNLGGVFHLGSPSTPNVVLTPKNSK